jgi:hypothetical protein
MADASDDARYQAYWEAIKRHVCSVCLDERRDGSCGLSGRVCAIERHLPGVVEAILHVSSDRMDEYVTAIESQICGKCSEQDPNGRCSLRNGGECSLYTYLPLIVDAIEESRTGRASVASFPEKK